MHVSEELPQLTVTGNTVLYLLESVRGFSIHRTVNNLSWYLRIECLVCEIYINHHTYVAYPIWQRWHTHIFTKKCLRLYEVVCDNLIMDPRSHTIIIGLGVLLVITTPEQCWRKSNEHFCLYKYMRIMQIGLFWDLGPTNPQDTPIRPQDTPNSIATVYRANQMFTWLTGVKIGAKLTG